MLKTRLNDRFPFVLFSNLATFWVKFKNMSEIYTCILVYMGMFVWVFFLKESDWYVSITPQ